MAELRRSRTAATDPTELLDELDTATRELKRAEEALSRAHRACEGVRRAAHRYAEGSPAHAQAAHQVNVTLGDTRRAVDAACEPVMDALARLGELERRLREVEEGR